MIIKEDGHDRRIIKAFYKFASLGYIYKGRHLVWKLIKAFIFTNDEQAIVTSDNAVIKCNDQ